PTRSRKSLEFLEVRLPFLNESIPSFAPLFREVKEEGRVAGELLQGGLGVAIGFERRLQAAEGHGAVLEDLAAPADGLGLELLVRDDPVHEAHLEGLLGVVLPAQKPDLAGLLLPDDARHVRGAVAAVEAADLGPGLPEARVVGRD